ncbi:MAG: phosphoglycerate mutase family protein [Desulfobacterales bacterium]|nr:phosphoglycerate mutase family protein [Desulfobacterales bacterium]
MSEIYFIRHAQASFENDNYDQLSALGVRQSQILGEYFRRLGLKFDSVYAGTMKRQVDTAREVLSRMPEDHTGLKLRRESAFDEYDFTAILKTQIPLMIDEEPALGEILARRAADRPAFQKLFERAVTRWISGRYDTGGIETWPDYGARIRGGIQQLMKAGGPQKRAAVFTSGGCVAVAVQMALDISDVKTIELSWQVRNTSVSVFKYGSRGLGLFSFNSTAHLEAQDSADLLTYR